MKFKLAVFGMLKSLRRWIKFEVRISKFETTCLKICILNPALAGLVPDFACLRRSGYAQAGASGLGFVRPVDRFGIEGLKESSYISRYQENPDGDLL
jgi:hypothetical protein